jgi:hypothetical protein
MMKKITVTNEENEILKAIVDFVIFHRKSLMEPIYDFADLKINDDDKILESLLNKIVN